MRCIPGYEDNESCIIGYMYLSSAVDKDNHTYKRYMELRLRDNIQLNDSIKIDWCKRFYKYQCIRFHERMRDWQQCVYNKNLKLPEIKYIKGYTKSIPFYIMVLPIAE